ncbi:hypothetical protein CSAL01_11602 [Colletotrichum salicis]|uniref:Uncharacterized protein n=1 Tax=Colletotrichum salicis TaxID=1209931 RepID=A0A135V299_9PEZI|nr:hypothetical protein CSAL01_11602 [Colletotrichum salicis]
MANAVNKKTHMTKRDMDQHEKSRNEMERIHQILNDDLSSWNEKAFDSDLWQGISEERKQEAWILKQEVLDKPLFEKKTRGGLVLNFGEDPKSNPEYFETQTAKLRTGTNSPMSHLVADWENTDIDAHKHNVNTIKWFCSVPFPNPGNEEERKIQESPRGMMCSLINQLLRVISDKFPEFILSGSFLDDKDFADRLKNREIQALW